MGKSKLDRTSMQRRRLMLEVLDKCRRGHLSSALSVAEIIRSLFDGVLRIDPKNPTWPDRDRFILSKGHSCLALYVEMAERGFFAREELFKFCAEDGILGGHPEYGTIPGIEASTGSLGHGLSIGVGMALAAKIDQKAYRTFIVLSDGECNEGSVWEAALHAAKHRLDNLIVFLDYNKMQCYAATKEVLDLEPLAAKWKAFGFEVKEVDGHDVAAIKKAAAKTPLKTGKPSMIICHTLKGKGIKVVENDPTWHHKARLKDDEMKALWSEFESVEEKRS